MYISLLYLLCISIQGFFFITILWKHTLYKHPKKNKFTPPVSIVVAAKNEETNLSRLIIELLRQEYPCFEIIIVDDQSTDNSLSILKSIKSNLFSFISISKPSDIISSKKNALTEGINKAKYSWILLTDADCLPASTRWVSNMVNHIEKNTEIVLGISPNHNPNNFLSKYIQFESFYTFLQYSTASLCNIAYMGVGRNLMYKKSLFMKQGFSPFNQIKSGDDDLFVNHHSNNKNTTICLTPEAYTYTSPKESIKDYLSQKRRHTSVGNSYTTKSKILTGLFFMSFGLSYVILVLSIPHKNIVVFSFSIILLALKQLCFTLINKKRAFSERICFFIFYDFIYFLYLSYSLVINLRKTKVEWK